MMCNEQILKIEGLNLSYANINTTQQILFDINLELNKNEILGIIGESGSGKSQMVLSILKLYDDNAIVSGRIVYSGTNLLELPEKEINKYRCKHISMSFQDSTTALNPYLTIGEQLIAPLLAHEKLKRSVAEKRAIEMLDIVKIKDPHKNINRYPYEFSGGMRQRVMIAMSLICRPKILIADELTTALDATTQNIVLDFIRQLKQEFNMSVVFITHDLRVLHKIADRIVVMYCGHVMEELPTSELFKNAKHPYTRGLLNSMPDIKSGKMLYPIPGEIPAVDDMPHGCPFAPRCGKVCDDCKQQKPSMKTTNTGKVACFNCYD